MHFEVGTNCCQRPTGLPLRVSVYWYVARKQEKPLEYEGYTGGIDRYTGGAQIWDENTLKRDRTTNVPQICFILMCWHDFGHWIGFNILISTLGSLWEYYTLLYTEFGLSLPSLISSYVGALSLSTFKVSSSSPLSSFVLALLGSFLNAYTMLFSLS